MGSRLPTHFPLPPKFERWWHAFLTTHRPHPDVAITTALERGLRWWILPCLPRDADWVARDAQNREWDQLIAHQGVVTVQRHAAPSETATLAAEAADFIHEVEPGGAFCVTPRPAPGQPRPLGEPVCVCGIFALTWQEDHLTQLALRLAEPLAKAVLRKMARGFAREAQQGPYAPVTANAAATLDVIVQALLWMYVQLMHDRAAFPRDPLAVRVARLCAAPMVLPDKTGHRSRIVGEEYEWWLGLLRDLVHRVMRPAFPKEQWATTGRTRDKQARFEKLRATWPTLPDAVLKHVKEQDDRGEAERRLTAALVETMAWGQAAPEAVRRAVLRHRALIRRFDAADRAADPE